MLFEFSEGQSLVSGIDLPDGGRLRVVPLESDAEMPDGLSARNADDRILAVARQVCSEGCEDLTLVTNDLNMLLKAQTFGVKVERRVEIEGGRAKQVVRWLQRYRVPITILAIALAVFAGVLALSLYTSNLGGNGSTGRVPDEFRDGLTAEYRNLLDGLLALEDDPNDTDALKLVGNSYYDLYNQTGNIGFAQSAIDRYERYLELSANDSDVRTDMAYLHFTLGSTDLAIQEVTAVLTTDPNHLEANFNLGIFYWRSSRNDYEGGANQLMKAIDLATASSDPHAEIIASNARQLLQQIKLEAEAAGITVEIPSSYLPAEGTGTGTVPGTGT
jgi:tetratricopeptide (TPR) repeat protein